MNNDMAISFNSLKQEIEKKITRLENIGLDVSAYRRQYDEIVNDTEKKAEKDTCSFTPCSIPTSIGITLIAKTYSNGISKLKNINDKLSEFNLYFKIYYIAESFKSQLNNSDELTDEKIDVMAVSIIRTLKMINDSDTKLYRSEKNIVEDIYDIAYEIAKLEVLYTGKSKVLEFARENEITGNYLDTKIMSDVTSLPDNDIVKRMVMRQYQVKGIDTKLLSDELMFLLSTRKNEKYLDTIYSKLVDISSEYNKNMKELATIEKQNTEIKNNIASMKKSHISFGELAHVVTFIGVAFGIIFGSLKLSKQVTKITKYRTEYDIYTTGPSIQYNEEDYTRSLDDYSNTIVCEYSSWKQRGNGFQREVKTSEPMTMKHDNLADYLDDKQYWKSIENENRDTITEEELEYNEVIKEVVKIIQNPDDYIVVEEGLTTALLLFAIVDIVAILSISCTDKIIFEENNFFALLKEEYWNIIDNIEISENKKQLVQESELKFNEYKTLLKRNEEIKQKFMEAYSRYKKLIDEKDLVNRGISRKLINPDTKRNS